VHKMIMHSFSWLHANIVYTLKLIISTNIAHANIVSQLRKRDQNMTFLRTSKTENYRAQGTTTASISFGVDKQTLPKTENYIAGFWRIHNNSQVKNVSSSRLIHFLKAVFSRSENMT
jgi:hypothetical protein